MAHKVFICHSSKDKQIADAACAALEAQRIPCWIAPRDILAGDEYGKSIVDALTCSQIVLLIFSSDANKSPQVRREIERAVSKGKIIVPFRIEDVMPSDAMEFALSNTHWLDALTPPLERYLVQLCDTISRLIQRSEAEAPLWQPRKPEEEKAAQSKPEIPAEDAPSKSEQVAEDTKPKPKVVQDEPGELPQQSQNLPLDTNQNKRQNVAPPDLTRIEKLKIVWRRLPQWQRAALSALALVALIAAVLLPVWMHFSLTLLHTIDSDSNIESVAFSPDGRTLASGSFVKPVTLWDVATGQPVRTLGGQSGPTNSVAFSPDGRTLASGNADDTIRLSDVASGQLLRTLPTHDDAVESVAFSRDGRTFASASLLAVQSWSVPSKSEMKSLESQPALLTGGNWDTGIQLWDLASGQLLRTLLGHNATVQSVSFSPDGRMLASGCADNTIELWDVAGGQLLRTLQGHAAAVASVAFSPDGRTLASGSGDRTIKLWDVASGQLLRTMSGHYGAVTSVAFSPDGQTLASGSMDHSIKIWDAASGKMVRTQKGDNYEVTSVAFSPDGRTLASGGTDDIKLWDVSNVK